MFVLYILTWWAIKIRPQIQKHATGVQDDTERCYVCQIVQISLWNNINIFNVTKFEYSLHMFRETMLTCIIM